MNDEKDPDRIAYKKKWREINRVKERSAQRSAYRKWRQENPLPPKPVKEKVVRKPMIARAAKVNKRDEVLMVVYVIEAGEFVKVGIAEDVVTRVSVFRTHCPLTVKLAYCSKQMLRPKARELELSCHAYLAEFHAHGEWFKTNSDSVIKFLGTVTEKAEEPKSPVQLKLVS